MVQAEQEVKLFMAASIIYIFLLFYMPHTELIAYDFIKTLTNEIVSKNMSIIAAYNIMHLTVR